MKYFLTLLLLLTSCSEAFRANRHLKRAQFHQRMAYALGADVENKTDTVYKEIITPVHHFDTLTQVNNFTDTIYTVKDRIITKIKIDVQKKTVYEKVQCPNDTIKVPIYITKTVKMETHSGQVIKWWWLLIALCVGFVVKALWK